ncbi:MAG TPA: glycosyltransferase family A protein [Gemmatimonadales bacterium]|nr:glycosyltransferase family A protein [Gemmatimonadales bacterium]
MSHAVSIIIPAYVTTKRQADLLAETLDTVAAQSCQDFETVVVDDGSPLAVNRIAAGRPRTIVLRQPNGGSARARNTGIAASHGRYLIFLDADDHLLPPAIEAGLARFRERPECGFVVGNREEMTYEGGPVPWSVPSMPRESRLYETLLAFDWYIIPPSSVMFRREVVEAVRGFRDPWGADDLDFYLRVARFALGWCYESPAVTRYRRYSASSSRDGERMLRSIRVVYDRQREVVRGDPALEAAFQRGLDRLTAIFSDCLVENVEDRLRAHEWRRAARSAALLARESPRRLARLAGRTLRSAL